MTSLVLLFKQIYIFYEYVSGKNNFFWTCPIFGQILDQSDQSLYITFWTISHQKIAQNEPNKA